MFPFPALLYLPDWAEQLHSAGHSRMHILAAREWACQAVTQAVA